MGENLPKLGILAGGDELPGRIIRACQLTGRPFFILAFRGQTDPETVAGAPHLWVRLGAVGEIIDALKAEKVEEIVLVGAIRRPSAAELRPDWRGTKILAKAGLAMLGDDGLLRVIAAELESEGFHVIGAHDVVHDLLAPNGILGRHHPTKEQEEDITRGIMITHVLGELDVGQAVIIQQGIVLGIEAAEGTDSLIERCKALKREGPGGVLVKTKKPQQDRRLDLPTVGLRTMKEAINSGLSGIAIQAGETIMLEKEAFIDLADEAGLFVLGFDLA